MKKTYIPLILLATITLTGCNNSTDDSGDKKENAVINNANDSEISYAYACVSTLDILDENSEGETSTGEETSKDDTTVVMPTEGETMDEEFGYDDIDLDSANKYLSMYDKLTNGESFLVYSEESDDEEYLYKVVIKTHNALEDEKVYSLYYNEVVIEEKDDEKPNDDVTTLPGDFEVPDFDSNGDENIDVSEVTLENARRSKHHDHRHEDESTLLKGIIVSGENKYDVKGKRVTGKYATRTSFITSISEDSFVNFSQVSSESFTSYNYRVMSKSDGYHHHHYDVTSEYTFLSYETEDFNGVFFTKYENGEFTMYNFSSFVIDKQEYFEIIYFDNFKEVGYVYAKVNYDEEGNKTIEYLFSKTEILEDEFKDHGRDHDFEREDEFKDHGIGHHGKDDHDREDFGKDNSEHHHSY